MAITLKYGAPGPVLLAGYAGGVGKRQQRQEENALELWQQQNQQKFQAQQAAIGRQFQFGMQQNQFGEQFIRDARNRQFAAQQDALGRDFQAGQQKNLLDVRRNEFALDRQDRLDEEDLKRRITSEGLRTGALVLPPKAQAELDKLEAGRAEVLEPGYDEVQRDTFMADYEKRKQALEGLAKPAGPTFDERVSQNLGEIDGEKYWMGPSGPTPLESQKAKQQKEQEKKQAEFQKDQQDYGKQVLGLAKDLRGQAGDFPDPLESYMDQSRAGLQAAGIKAPQAPMDVSGVDAQALAKFGGFELAGGLTKIPPAPATTTAPASAGAAARLPPPPSLSTDPSNMPPGPPLPRFTSPSDPAFLKAPKGTEFLDENGNKRRKT